MHSSPYGAAGGALKGAYPNPTLIVEEGNLQMSARVFDSRAAAFATQLSPGLSVWNSGVSRATPNATIPVHWLAPNTGATNADIAIVPRGNGAFMLSIPDNNTSPGGNKRGLRAVDLSRNRSANTAVAAATDSFAAGTDITIATTATGACGLGTGLTLNGVSSFATGQGGIADGDYSTALGRASRSRGVVGAVTGSSGSSSTTGDRQWVIFSARCLTADAATTVVLTTNAGAPSVTNTWALANNSCATFVAYITGRSGTAGAASWKVEGLVYKDGAGTTVVVLDAASPRLMASRGTGSATTATVAANVANDTPEMRVTGFAPATNGSWFGILILTEVVG